MKLGKSYWLLLLVFNNIKHFSIRLYIYDGNMKVVLFVFFEKKVNNLPLMLVFNLFVCILLNSDGLSKSAHEIDNLEKQKISK